MREIFLNFLKQGKVEDEKLRKVIPGYKFILRRIKKQKILSQNSLSNLKKQKQSNSQLFDNSEEFSEDISDEVSDFTDDDEFPQINDHFAEISKTTDIKQSLSGPQSQKLVDVDEAESNSIEIKVLTTTACSSSTISEKKSFILLNSSGSSKSSFETTAN